MKPLSKVPMVPMGMPLSDLQLWGGKLTKGSSCVPKSIIASMLRLCLGAQWTVPNQCLSASDIPRQAHCWRHSMPLMSTCGLRTPHWLYLIFLKMHSSLESFHFLSSFCPSLRVIILPWPDNSLSLFQLPPDFLSQAFFLINLCTFNPI